LAGQVHRGVSTALSPCTPCWRCSMLASTPLPCSGQSLLSARVAL